MKRRHRSKQRSVPLMRAMRPTARPLLLWWRLSLKGSRCVSLCGFRTLAFSPLHAGSFFDRLSRNRKRVSPRSIALQSSRAPQYTPEEGPSHPGPPSPRAEVCTSAAARFVNPMKAPSWTLKSPNVHVQGLGHLKRCGASFAPVLAVRTGSPLGPPSRSVCLYAHVCLPLIHCVIRSLIDSSPVCLWNRQKDTHTHTHMGTHTHSHEERKSA